MLKEYSNDMKSKKEKREEERENKTIKKES